MPGNTHQQDGPDSFSQGEFERLVQQALDSLPADYQRLMKNVVVVIEDEATPEVLSQLGLDSPGELLGLYTGVAQGKESFFDASAHLPSRISIYRRPILEICHTADDVIREVRETVTHEIGHHFGLEDEEMPY